MPIWTGSDAIHTATPGDVTAIGPLFRKCVNQISHVATKTRNSPYSNRVGMSQLGKRGGRDAARVTSLWALFAMRRKNEVILWWAG